LYVFFFQAEDGIRDLIVTGVQTCALPIWDDFRDGRLRDYHGGIAARLRDVAMTADVVVLAQASMAPAADLCRDIGVPILSSPVTGFQAAIASMVPEMA